MYKIYESGEDFCRENADILNGNPMATVFMEGNSRFAEANSKEKFAVKVENGVDRLLAVGLCGVPLRIFGDVSLSSELAEVCARHGFVFDDVLGYPDVCENFLCEYEKLCGGTHNVKHSMNIMFCTNPVSAPTDNVRFAEIADVKQLTEHVFDFMSEALGEKSDKTKLQRQVEDGLCDVVLCEKDWQVVSMARKTEEKNNLCRISWVYTVPKYRSQGLSKRVVTYLTQRIVADGKIPYLFVDKTNPISNHLYMAIGYEYAMPLFEFSFSKQN